MKRKSLIVVLTIAITLSFSVFAFAAPNISGTWEGTVMRVRASVGCSSLPVTLTINQCNNSNLVVGSLTVGGNNIFNVTGRIKANGVIVTISGSNGDYADGAEVTLTGKYVAGSPDQIQINKVDWMQFVDYELENVLYDAFTLTKQ